MSRMSRRDVIWITLESVRQERTSIGGHERETTPNLLSLAESLRGAAFEQCFSHDIWTRSSSASILTGLPPSAHRTWSDSAKLPGAIETIPEAFRDEGYRTVCVSPNPQLSPSTGLDQGFDTFHYIDRSTLLDEVPVRSLLKWALMISHHSAGPTLDGQQHCLGYLFNEIAKRHISHANRDDQPLFLYVHHGDSHHPYCPPKSWMDHFWDNIAISQGDARDYTLEVSRTLHRTIAEDDPLSGDELEALKTLYDTTVRYVDHLTGRLIEFAESELDDPVIVVTGDHGELFQEHGLFAHMLVTHSAVSNVPLVVSGIDDLPDGGLVQHADVMEMVCSDLGINHPVPVGQDIREEPREFAVTQRGGERAQKKLDEITQHNPDFDVEAFHTAALTAIRSTEWRYQRSAEGAELFAVRDGERDVSEENPELVDRLDNWLTNWIETSGEPVGDVEAAEFDDQLESRLSELGYL